jgi:Ni/Fe-hydrogenase subunit HybB-like protein
MLVLVTAGRRSGLAVGLVALLSAICFIGIRWNIVLPGFALPELPGLEYALVEPHLNYLARYTPTIMEWQVSAFAIGIALILFAVGYHLLPLEKEPSTETWQRQEVSR